MLDIFKCVSVAFIGCDLWLKSVLIKIYHFSLYEYKSGRLKLLYVNMTMYIFIVWYIIYLLLP